MRRMRSRREACMLTPRPSSFLRKSNPLFGFPGRECPGRGPAGRAARNGARGCQGSRAMRKLFVVLVLGRGRGAHSRRRRAGRRSSSRLPSRSSTSSSRPDPGGDTFQAQAVVDTYGGSTLVSVRPGGSRVIVDSAKRTVTGSQRREVDVLDALLSRRWATSRAVSRRPTNGRRRPPPASRAQPSSRTSASRTWRRRP